MIELRCAKGAVTLRVILFNPSPLPPFQPVPPPVADNYEKERVCRAA